MTARPAAPSPAEADYRLMIMLFPRSWRQRHGDEALAILLEEADRERWGRVSLRSMADLLVHAIAARLDAAGDVIFSRLPGRIRYLPGTVAMIMLGAMSIIMLAGEVAGALHRPSPVPYSAMFISGPFLTVGVALDIGFILAAVALIIGRSGWARAVLMASTALAGWLVWPGGLAGIPQPMRSVTFAFLVLGLLALTGTSDPSRHRRIVTGVVAGALAGAGLGVLGIVTGQLGWAPVQSFDGSLLAGYAGWVVAYLVVGAGLVVAVVAAIRTAVTGQFGGLLMIIGVALVISTLHAVLADWGSPSLLAWLWPLACLVVGRLVIIRLRRRVVAVPAPVGA